MHLANIVFVDLQKLSCMSCSSTCRNFANIVVCRELQKLSLHDAPDAKLLKSLYSGHCTSILAKNRNNGYFRKLSNEFSKCVRQGGFVFIDHNPGHDAAKSARVFLHYHGASMVSCSADPVSKKARVSDSAKRNESC